MQALESDAARIQQTLTTLVRDVAEARHEFVSSVQQQLGDASGGGAPRHEEGLGAPSPVHDLHSDHCINLFGSDEDNSAASLPVTDAPVITSGATETMKGLRSSGRRNSKASVLPTTM